MSGTITPLGEIYRELYLVQVRPETVAAQRCASVLEIYSIEGRGEVLASGRSVGEKSAPGDVRLAVEGCRRHSGLCGQASSDYPEMTQSW